MQRRVAIPLPMVDVQDRAECLAPIEIAIERLNARARERDRNDESSDDVSPTSPFSVCACIDETTTTTRKEMMSTVSAITFPLNRLYTEPDVEL